MVGKVHLNRDLGGAGGDSFFVEPTTSFLDRKPKQKKKTEDIEELRLDNVNDNSADDHNRSRIKVTSRIPTAR